MDSLSILETIKIGTRDSKLAIWQAEYVKNALNIVHKNYEYKLVKIKTIGDISNSAPLYSLSDKGLFTKEIDKALLNHEIDIAVHSLKDLQTNMNSKLKLCAIIKRHSPNDLIIFSNKININNFSFDKHINLIIGTSSVRRKALLSKNFPNIKTKNIRGNIDTRLKKLYEADSKYSGIMLAAAGIERLNINNKYFQKLDIEKFPYAVGQGALAVVCRTTDKKMIALVKSINDNKTALCCIAERALLKKLEGGCKAPIAVSSYFQKENQLVIKGYVISLNGKQFIHKKLEDTVKDENSAMIIGIKLANSLIEEGAMDILKQVRKILESKLYK